MSIPQGCGLVIVDDALSADIGGEYVVLSHATQKYYGLAGVAARIWEHIRSGATVGQIEAALLAEFQVEPERLRRDLQEFLAALVDHGLVKAGAELMDASAGSNARPARDSEERFEPAGLRG